MKRLMSVLLVIGIAMLMVGCGGPPSNRYVKKVFRSEFKTLELDRNLSIDLQSFKILNCKVTSSETETYYTYSIEGVFYRKFSAEEIAGERKSDKGMDYTAIKQVRRYYDFSFVKRRGEWFYDSGENSYLLVSEEYIK